MRESFQFGLSGTALAWRNSNGNLEIICPILSQLYALGLCSSLNCITRYGSIPSLSPPVSSPGLLNPVGLCLISAAQAVQLERAVPVLDSQTGDLLSASRSVVCSVHFILWTLMTGLLESCHHLRPAPRPKEIPLRPNLLLSDLWLHTTPEIFHSDLILVLC